MSNKDMLDRKFEIIQNEPTELSISEVQALIHKLPALAVAKVEDDSNPSDFNSTDFINLKILLMILLPTAIAIAFFTMGNPTENTSHSEITSPVIEAKEISTTAGEPIEIPLETQTDASTYGAIKNSINDHKSISSPFEKAKPLTVDMVPNDKSTKDIPANKITSPRPSKENITELVKVNPRPSSSYNYKVTTIPTPTTTRTIVPNFTDRFMRKMKRTLYKELMSDQLVRYKGAPILMKLMEDQIIVNDQLLSDQLYLKYRALTAKVGYGEFRRIEINDQYIKIGDFFASGFKGSGLGTFMTEQKTTLPKPTAVQIENERWEKLWKTERKALKEYCDKMLTKTDQGLTKGSTKFGVNMSSKKFTEFFQVLQERLEVNKFFSSTTPYVLITLPKNNIWINGKELNGKMKTEYLALMSAFNIKSGPQRMIRLSKHTISVGDFTKGKFSGTSADYKNTFVE